MVIDIRNYYLNNPMYQFYYILIHIKYFPQEVIYEYNLHDIMDERGHFHVELCKGMYGIKEKRIISYKFLVKNLKSHGYSTVEQTPGLWKHNDLHTLAVDDFSIKLSKTTDADHLISTLKQK